MVPPPRFSAGVGPNCPGALGPAERRGHGTDEPPESDPSTSLPFSTCWSPPVRELGPTFPPTVKGPWVGSPPSVAYDMKRRDRTWQNLAAPRTPPRKFVRRQGTAGGGAFARPPLPRPRSPSAKNFRAPVPDFPCTRGTTANPPNRPGTARPRWANCLAKPRPKTFAASCRHAVPPTQSKTPQPRLSPSPLLQDSPCKFRNPSCGFSGPARCSVLPAVPAPSAANKFRAAPAAKPNPLRKLSRKGDFQPQGRNSTPSGPVPRRFRNRPDIYAGDGGGALS